MRLDPRRYIRLSLAAQRLGISNQELMLGALDKYLDDAYLASLPFTRIIHGKGTGTLRHVVREALAEHPLVATSDYNAGGTQIPEGAMAIDEAT